MAKRTKWNIKPCLQGLVLLCLVLFVPACITINIYFPAAAAEKAADKVIDEIWQSLPDGSTNSPTEQNNENKPTTNSSDLPNAGGGHP